MVRCAAVAALTASALLLVAETAAACSCAYLPPEEQLRGADGAVTARLLRVKPVGDSPFADFVYRTGRVVKGRPLLRRGRRLVVRSVGSESICGLPRHVDDPIGLFLERDAGRWRSGLCSTIPARQMLRLPPARAAAAGARGERSAPIWCSMFLSMASPLTRRPNAKTPRSPAENVARVVAVRGGHRGAVPEGSTPYGWQSQERRRGAKPDAGSPRR